MGWLKHATLTAETSGCKSLFVGAEQRNATTNRKRAAQSRRISAPSWMSGQAWKRHVPFAVLAGSTLALDLASKAWAVARFSEPQGESPNIIVLVPGHLDFRLTHNQAGAWGFLRDTDPMLRVPFFVCVSAVAIVFILSVYARARPEQRALRYALPLVLGGALGNAADRILRVGVVDFIGYRADWVRTLNQFIARFMDGWTVTSQWPIFNVADVAICVGVGLMAVDMFSRTKSSPSVAPSQR